MSQTRTYSAREQNVMVVQAELERHKLTQFPSNLLTFWCSCKPVGPANVYTADSAHKHVAEQIVRAQNEWVRSQ
jgi:hypothetical protein